MSGARAPFRGLVRAIVTSTPLVGLLLSTPPALADQNKLSFDVGAAFPSGPGNDDGFGLGLRYGHEWDLAIISLIPELGLGYHAFSGPNDAKVVTAQGGGRVAIGFVLEPSVYAHAGVGHSWSDRATFTAFAYDVGAALDLTVLPVVDFGPHLTLGGVAGNESPRKISWLEIGGHLTFNVP
jgi:hypothetical protein